MSSSGFIRKKVHTLTLGERLKKLRNDKRISIQDVSKHTGIKMEYLEFLESGQYDKLPADVYVKGFLRSYAGYVCASSDALIRLFECERGIQEFKELGSRKKESHIRKHISSFVFTPKMVVVVLVGIAVFGGFLYLYNEFDNFISEPQLTITQPTSGSLVDALSISVYGFAERDANVFINGQNVLVDEKGNFQQEVELHQGMNTITIEAENVFNKRAKKEIVLESTFQESAEEILEVSDEKDGTFSSVEVYVKNEATWIQVIVDTEEVYSGIIGVDDLLEYSAEESLQISSGNGTLTHVIIDGKDLGMISDSQEVVENWEYLFNEDVLEDEGE